MDLVWRLIRTRLVKHARGLAVMFLIAATVSATPYGFAMLGRWLVDEALQVSGPPKTQQQAAAEGPVAEQGLSIEWKAKTPEEKLRLLTIFFVASLSVHVVVTGLSGASELINSRISNRLIFGLRTSVQAKLASMEVAAFSQEQLGQRMTRVIEDVPGIPGNLTNLVISALTQACMLVLGVVLLLRLNAKMALVVVGVLPFYAFTCIFFLPRIKKNTEALRDKVAQFNGFVIERLTNVATIKNYSQEDREVASLGEWLDANLALSRRQHRLDLYFGTLTTIITGLGTLAVLALGFLNIKAGKMQIGEVLAFHGVTAQLFVPISALVGLGAVAQTIQALATRVYAVLDARTTLSDAADATVLPSIKGDVSFSNVSLRYEEGGPFAVHDISLAIPAGATVCLVGATGCGKSTLISLLTRLYDPTEGTIAIDGVDIRSMPLRALRHAVGNVLHDCPVFSGTLAENIAYGRPGASPADIEDVSRAVGLQEVVDSLPGGYETKLGRGGITLDAEQLARLGLARALLTKPAILTIDDTYSTMEEDAEGPLRTAVRTALSGHTILIATSRLSLCEDADMVIVMQRGTTAQLGTHQQLLADPGVYRRMYMRQMGIDDPSAST